MPHWPAIASQLRDAGFDVREGAAPRPVGGGDISAAWSVDTNGGRVFVKTGPRAASGMFSAEAAGLQELAGAGALRVPRVLTAGVTETDAYVALEWLDLQSPDAASDRLLGKQLAEMHRATAEKHGWHRDNTIGSTPQVNRQDDNWTSFFSDCRIHYQVELAARNGFGGRLQRLGEELLAFLPALFAEHAPQPSLLHGDLWSGNYAVTAGNPVIFDPAVYYGDRETDLAMTRLFGGFGSGFYAAYEDAWPLPAGHERRLAVYQLYHVLNHLNLFGGGYLARAEALIRATLGAS